MDVEENVPPTKKLKQAKLSFFKGSGPPLKRTAPPSNNQGVKRKNLDGSDSPNKAAKLSKPLNPAVINAESPSHKAATTTTKVLKTLPQESSGSKVGKGTTKNVINKKMDEVEENDQEVSSSSEAEASTGKTSGKCCLMERFVVKLPPDTHQEISSTINVQDISVGSSGHKNLSQEDKEDTLEIKNKINDNEADCFIVKDGYSDVKQNIEATNDEKEKIDTTSFNPSDEDKDIINSSKSKRELSSNKSNEIDLDISITEIEGKEDEKIPSSLEACTPHKENSEGTCKSLTINLTPIDKSTPVRKRSLNSTLTTPQSSNSSPQTSACETPATSSGKKRGRKIDSTKKAEKDAQKQKLKEEKEKAREEKKKKLEEEKMKKELARKELKEAKEKEKQEQKEKLEQEKQEKLKQKEEEKKKKEEERLKKEEEKQKIIEAKQEEKRKKEEERKQKEEEKKQKEEEKQREEEEKRKKAEKSKQAFQSFFIKSREPEPKPSISKNAQSFFIPFEVKKDMHLAPPVRMVLSDEKRQTLEKSLKSDQETKNYLGQLKNGEVKPHRCGRILRKNKQPEEDVEVIHDSEALKKVFHEVKLLQFHTDYRPPYYGTWRKQPKLNPRNPWTKDEKMFDYEVDSDDEWEEEEPGESLSCSEGEEEKGEEVDEEEEDGDGWMVPHGYLSEDEGCNEDDEVTPEKLKLQQQAKAKAWEDEQKRKLQAAPLVAVGCFFEHSPSSNMSGDVRLLYEFRGVILAPVVPIPTNQMSQTESEDTNLDADGSAQTPGLKGRKDMTVPDEAMPDLIKLLHGNPFGIKKLVREFRVYWLKKNDQMSTENTEAMNESIGEDRDISMLNDSAAESVQTNEIKDSPDKTEDKESISQPKQEEGYGCSISKRQLEKKIFSITVDGKRQERPGCNKMCWYVKDEVLSQFNLTDMTLPNTWVYLSSVSTKSASCANKSTLVTKNEVVENTTEEEKVKAADQKSIMAFTMSKEDLIKQASLKPKVVIDETPVQVTPIKEPVSDQKSIMAFTMTKEELKKQTSLKPKVSSVKPKELNKLPEPQGQSTEGSSTNISGTIDSKLTSLPKTQVANSNKKPKVSIMDMFKKKTPLKKESVKKCPSVKELTENVEKVDSDVEILDGSPTKVSPSSKSLDSTVKSGSSDLDSTAKLGSSDLDSTVKSGSSDLDSTVKSGSSKNQGQLDIKKGCETIEKGGSVEANCEQTCDTVTMEVDDTCSSQTSAENSANGPEETSQIAQKACNQEMEIDQTANNHKIIEKMVHCEDDVILLD